MRILHINCNYASNPLHQLMIEHLAQLGIENMVYVPIHNSSDVLIESKSNVCISKCFHKWDRMFFYHKQKKIFSDVEKHFNIKDFDLIHAYTLFTDGYCAMCLSKKYNIPYVVAVRNTDVNVFFKYMLHLRRLGVTILSNAAKIFFLSFTYKNTVINRYIPSKFKEYLANLSVVIPNGIDNFWLQNKYIAKDYNTIERVLKHKQIKLIYVGSIDRNKNITLTIKAIKILEEKGWKVRFDVVGEIIDYSVFNSIMLFMSYTNKIKKEELIKKYRYADIFVMPSHHESFGLVYAEAMSQGLPVIYTQGEGFDEQFAEGEVGYSVNDNNEKDLAEKIIKIVENYCEISRNCIKNSNKFDWSKITQQYKYFYLTLITKR